MEIEDRETRLEDQARPALSPVLVPDFMSPNGPSELSRS